MNTERTEQLFQRCRQGNAAAQKELYNLFSKKMYLVCYRYVKSKEDAEDVLAEGFVKVLRHLKTMEYHGEEGFVAWMRKIMVNEALQFLRKKKKIIFQDVETEIADTETSFSALCAEDLYRFITELPAGMRTVFNLYVIEGYSHAEISSMLSITESASRAQLSKARHVLQQQISQNNGGL